MTKLPVEQVRIGKGIDDLEVETYGVCQMPLCVEGTVDRHHIVRRSHLGGAYDAVVIDHQARSNIVELCRPHHQEVTENKADILFDGGLYWWSTQGEKDLSLKPQPALTNPPEGGVVHTVAFPGPLDKMKIDATLEQCPRCKGKGRVPAKDPEQKPAVRRKYRTWAMGIPVDSGENGYEIWVESLQQCTDKLRPILGFTETVPPYYVLIAVTNDWLNT